MAGARVRLALAMLALALTATSASCTRLPAREAADAAPPSAERACLPLMNASIQLALNKVHQVMVRWHVDGGCPPIQGELKAWYQDEPAPDHIYPITQPDGELLDKPILHFGSWDRDYYLEVVDARGQRISVMNTIGVGR